MLLSIYHSLFIYVTPLANFRNIITVKGKNIVILLFSRRDNFYRNYLKWRHWFINLAIETDKRTPQIIV